MPLPVVRIPVFVGLATRSDDDPQVVTDAAGNWVAVWESTAPLNGIGVDQDILVARSADNGVTWTDPKPLNNNAGTDSGEDGGPQVTTDAAGYWSAVWHSTENLGGIGTDYDILVARSTDNGATWTDPEPLDDHAGDDIGADCTPQTTTDAAGNWVAVWRSNEDLGGIGTDNDILVARSVDMDCNTNGIPDECDITSGTSTDYDGDGIPDECEGYLTVPIPYATIQAAIDASTNGDTVMVGDGTYTGVGNKDLFFAGKAVTVRSGKGPENCVIDCQGTGRGFYFSGEGPDTIIDGFTVENGNGAGLNVGGAVFCMTSSPTIRNCRFSSCTAPSDGGAISCDYSDPLITGCLFESNSAPGRGGALSTYESSPTIEDCTFINNHTDGDGGAIASHRNSNTTVLSCSFLGNSAGDLTFGRGGGISHTGNSQSTVLSCVFSGNTASNGGAIYGAQPMLTNCTFVGNSATGEGGGLWFDSPSSPVTNCILWANTAPGSATPEAAQIDLGTNGSVDINFSCVLGWSGARGGTGNFAANPLFVDEVGTDGLAGTLDDDLHLTALSPCIEAGTNGAPALPAEDFEGEARIQQCRADIGADETAYFPDCNTNGVSDTCDISSGTSQDCNTNGVPDECDLAGAGPWQGVYEPALTTLPQDQGWTYVDDGGAPTPEASTGILHHGPSGDAALHFWPRLDIPIDLDQGVVVEWGLKILDSTYEEPWAHNDHWRTGYSLHVGDDDTRRFVIGIAADAPHTGVIITNTLGWPLSSSTSFISFDPTDDFHHYRFEVLAGLGSLYIDGMPMASLAIGAPWGGDPAGLRFGDSTSTGWCEAEMLYLRYAQYRAEDCNTNGLADECDIAAGTSLDCNGNWIPDECDVIRWGDFDADNDVDLDDYAALADCLAGPDVPPDPAAPECVDTCLDAFDFDYDDDVDLQDFARFQRGFGSPPAPHLVIDTVTVGNPGNAADTRYETPGYGGVAYTYNISRYEVTAGQYCDFLNAVAATDTYDLYNTQMWASYDGCKIERSGISGSYRYSAEADWADRPANFISWGDAARFANWLHNGQPTGAQDLTTTEDGSYYLNGATSDAELLAVVREPDATWVIPSEDEWYKVAYHKNDGVTGNYWDYPTASNAWPTSEAPPGTDMTNGSANYYDEDNGYAIGSPYYRTEVGAYNAKPSDSPYGTFDQGGNVWEWNEAIISGSYRGVRGTCYADIGYWGLVAVYQGYTYPTCEEHGWIGLRVSEIN